MAKDKDNAAMGDLFADSPTPVPAPPAPSNDGTEPQTQPQAQPQTQPRAASPVLALEQVAAQQAISAENLGADERYLKDREVAERFGIVRQTVWKRVEPGFLPAPIKLPPNSTRWRLSSLLAFEETLAKTLRQPHQNSHKPGRAK